MALESLAPDQRAVVELVLKQGRSYEELAGMLGISDAAVRGRACAGITALASDGGLDAGARGRVTDYLLGQLDERDRASADALLSRSPSARAWAQEVTAALEPVAGRELAGLPPERPAEHPAPAPPPAPPTRSSKLGGAILIGCVLLLAALATWLLTRDDGRGPASTPASAAPSATPAATSRALAEIPLRAVGRSKAEGLLQVNATDGRVGIVVVARNVEPSGPGEAYAVWLTDARRTPFRIGFEAKDAGGQGAQKSTLAFAGPSPDVDRARFARALTQYDDLVVSLERSDRASRPASIILRGSLKKLQGD